MTAAAQCIDLDYPNIMTMPSGDESDNDSPGSLISRLCSGYRELWEATAVTLSKRPGDVINALNETYIEYSQDDWDGYGAKAITADAYEEAKKIVGLLPSWIRKPEIVPEPTGEIAFEWWKGVGQVFVMSVGGKHRITYASLLGGNRAHGIEYFDESLPSIIITHLRRLFL